MWQFPPVKRGVNEGWRYWGHDFTGRNADQAITQAAPIYPDIVVSDGSGAVTATVIAGVESGVLELVSPSDASPTAGEDIIGVQSGLIARPDRGGIIFEARISQVTAITNRLIFVGLTDTTADEYPATIAAADAITTTFSDGAGFVYDTRADTDEWFCIAVDSDTDHASNGRSNIVPAAAAVEETLGIYVSSLGDVDFWRNRRLVRHMNRALSPDVVYTAAVLVSSNGANAVTMRLDAIDLWWKPERP